MTSTISAVVILALTLSAVPADAADDPPITPPINGSDPLRAIPISENVAWGDDKVSRPPTLVALYVSYASLQAYDVYSTRRALAHGAREANPVMQSVVVNTPAFLAVKAAAGIATVFASERLWKKNKTAALAVMFAANSVAAVVAARNALTLRRVVSGASMP